MQDVFLFNLDEDFDIDVNLTWYVCSVENDAVVEKANKTFKVTVTSENDMINENTQDNRENYLK